MRGRHVPGSAPRGAVMADRAVKENGHNREDGDAGEGGEVSGIERPVKERLPEDPGGGHVHDQGKWRDDREEEADGEREGVDRVLAGAAAAVGQRVGKLHGLYAVNAQDRLDLEEPEHQPEAAEDALDKEEDPGKRPDDAGHPAADDETDGPDGDAGDPAGIDGAADDLGEDPPGAQKKRIQLAGLHHAGKIPGDAATEKLREVEGHGHQTEEEVEIPRRPLMQMPEAVDQQDDGQKLRPLHDELAKCLQRKGQRILQMTFHKDGHRF